MSLGLPTLIAIAVYLAGINVLGAVLGRGQRDAKDYFLGSHAIPWWAVMASIVATETSALTFLSIPGDAYRTGFTFLQLAFGYLLGRIAVSALLLPGYFQGEITTAYALLERRFGVGARRFASLIFMVTRVLAASVRLAVPAIPIALILGVPVWVAILILAAATALYTFLGGLKAVIWIDLIQVVVYLSGAVMALWALLSAFGGGFGGFEEILRKCAEQGRPVHLFNLSRNLSEPYTLWAGVIGGAVLAMASHGADQLIVQRLLACRGLRDAQKALVGSGILVILQFCLFLGVGVGLFAFYGGRAVGPGGFATSDEIFPSFIVGHLPPFISAYLIAGIFSAAMCSESSALNSLASALSLDIVAPLLGKGARGGAEGARSRQGPDAFLDDRSRRAGRRFLAPAAERPGRAGRLGPRERDGGRPSRRVPARAVGEEGESDGRDDRHRDIGRVHVRPVAGLEGLRAVRAREDDRVAVVLAARLLDHVLSRLGPFAAARREGPAARVPSLTPTSRA